MTSPIKKNKINRTMSSPTLSYNSSRPIGEFSGGRQLSASSSQPHISDHGNEKDSNLDVKQMKRLPEDTNSQPVKKLNLQIETQLTESCSLTSSSQLAQEIPPEAVEEDNPVEKTRHMSEIEVTTIEATTNDGDVEFPITSQKDKSKMTELRGVLPSNQVILEPKCSSCTSAMLAGTSQGEATKGNTICALMGTLASGLNAQQKDLLLNVTPTTQRTLLDETTDIDEESQRGIFGWYQINGLPIPYIKRQEERYVALRMVEKQYMSAYQVYLAPASYYFAFMMKCNATQAEADLLTEINFNHCNKQFGRERFSSQDFIMRVQDVVELLSFLEFILFKLQIGQVRQNERVGFMCIGKKEATPYVVENGKKYFPLFLFHKENYYAQISNQSSLLGGWPLTYLKFCLKVQGINCNHMDNSNVCQVVSLDLIKSCVAANIHFRECWPFNKDAVRKLLNQARSRKMVNPITTMLEPQPKPAPRPACTADATVRQQ